MNPQPRRNPNRKVIEAAQNALNDWNTQAPSVTGNPRPNKLLKVIATASMGALLLAGCSAPDSNTLSSAQPSEVPFSSQGIEYIRLCKNTADETRAEDASCEAAESANSTPAPSESASATPTDTASPAPTETGIPSPRESATPTPTETPTSAPTDGNNGGTNINISNSGSSGGDAHHGGSATNAFIWYYIGYMWAQNSNGSGTTYTNNYYSGNVPGVGAPLRGGSDTIPNKGTVYQGLPSSGGSFTDSYRAARAKTGVQNGKVVTTQKYGNTVTGTKNNTGSNTSGSGSSNSSSGNSTAAAVAGAGAAGAVAANKAGNNTSTAPASSSTSKSNPNAGKSTTGSAGSSSTSKTDSKSGTSNSNSSSSGSGSNSNSSNKSSSGSSSNSGSSSSSKSGGSSGGSSSSSSKSGGSSSSGGSKGGFGGGSKSGGGTSGG